jgi:hypothetical protein
MRCMYRVAAHRAIGVKLFVLHNYPLITSYPTWLAGGSLPAQFRGPFTVPDILALLGREAVARAAAKGETTTLSRLNRDGVLLTGHDNHISVLQFLFVVLHCFRCGVDSYSVSFT